MSATHTMASSMAALQMFGMQKVGGIWTVDLLDASNRHNPLYHGSLLVIVVAAAAAAAAVVVVVVLHTQAEEQSIKLVIDSIWKEREIKIDSSH